MSQPSAATKASSNAAAPEGGAKPRILIVDDEPSMRDMLRIVLRRDGYDVVVAGNGTEAIAILEKDRIDLLLSDIRMPLR
jgi:CheY-like chemotaxis protein